VAAIVEKLAREALPGDTIALLSNGAFGESTSGSFRR